MIEVEIKLPVKELEALKNYFIKMGFQEVQQIRERDTYFDNISGSIRTNGEALRVRETIDLTTGLSSAQMNFKGKKIDSFTMTRQELETGVEQGAICREILEAIGFRPVEPEVIKERTMMIQRDVHACLDRVENLGEFLELEILVDEECDKEEALGQITELLRKLGYDMSDTVRTSYLSMLQGRED